MLCFIAYIFVNRYTAKRELCPNFLEENEENYVSTIGNVSENSGKRLVMILVVSLKIVVYTSNVKYIYSLWFDFQNYNQHCV